MSERTVWSNRLIDGLKIDAIILNGTNWIDATSIADWSVTDAEFLYLNWVTSPIQAQIDSIDPFPNWAGTGDMLYYDGTDWSLMLAGTEWQIVKYVSWLPVAGDADNLSQNDPIVNDTNDLTAWWGNTVVADDWAKTITVTYPDWSYTIYWETWIGDYWEDWNLISFNTKTWIYDIPTQSITYNDWTVIDWVADTISTTDWKIAYQNQPNTFTENNIFEWDSIFKWNVAFPYFRIDMNAITTIAFDWSNWTKQRTINHGTWWTHTLNLTNLYSGSNYSLMIRNTSWWNITLAMWTASNVNWSSMWIYWIWSMVNNLVLSDTTGWWGLHLFVMDTFDTWVHISYVWESLFLA